MKRKILRIEDSNIAGSRWSYSVWLHRRRGGSYALTFSQSARGEDRLPVTPVEGLTSGAALYQAVASMLEEVGYEIDDFLESLAQEIGAVDSALSAQFVAAPEALEAEDEARELAVEEDRKIRLEPFNTKIEAYVQRFSDEKLHYPGAGRVYPSGRVWMRRFIEQYVLAHGTLPVGKHEIEVPGYSGGTHDFSDWDVE